MKQVKWIFGKSKVLLLALALIGGSTAILITSINSAQAAQENQVIVTVTKPAAILEEEVNLPSPIASSVERKFTIVDMKPIPASKKGITPDYIPSEKDISREAAADKISEKITSLVGNDLEGYTAEFMIYLLKERSTWLGIFTSADQKTSYVSKIDAVTGEVWLIDRTIITKPLDEWNPSTNDELFNNSKAVFGYDIRASMEIFK